jgi:hypothetical protein
MFYKYLMLTGQWFIPSALQPHSQFHGEGTHALTKYKMVKRLEYQPTVQNVLTTNLKKMKIEIFRIIIQCTVIGACQCFGGTHCFQLQDGQSRKSKSKFSPQWSLISEKTSLYNDNHSTTSVHCRVHITYHWARSCGAKKFCPNPQPTVRL